MNICIYEDNEVNKLAPLNHLRHTSEIICGAFTLKEKLENFLEQDTSVTLIARKYLEGCLRDRFPKTPVNTLHGSDCIFLNSRVIFTKKFIRGLLFSRQEFKDSAILKGNTVIAFHLSQDRVKFLKNWLQRDDNLISMADIDRIKLKKIQVSDIDRDESEEIKVIKYPSDIIIHHEEELRRDIDILFSKRTSPQVPGSRANYIKPREIRVAKDCNVNPGAVIDGTGGRVWLSAGAVIEPFVYISGPVYIGEGTTVRSGSRLYGPLSVGDRCKISGEITGSVIHSYVNKQHLGFLGHSYLCEWVNLGAGTTTSNMKNNYSSVSLGTGTGTVDTGTIFLGSFIGDHTKTGINTMLNTGSLIGVSCNLFGCGYHQKLVRSFSWADAGNAKPSVYEIDKALKTAVVSMRRRGVRMRIPYEKMLDHLFKIRKHLNV